MPKLLSVSFILLVLMAAALAAGTAWMAADRISAGGRESLDVIMYPDGRLREPARPVEDVGVHQERITRLFELLRNTMGQTGADVLSAPQAGVPERIIVVRTGIGLSSAGGEFVCMVNPRIVDGEGASIEVEGCFSLPRGDWKTEVSRFETVTVEYLAPDGQVEEKEFSGADARHIQHGIDHLDGILVQDRAERDRLNGKLAAAAAIYLLALTVAAGWYIRNRVRSGKGMA